MLNRDRSELFLAHRHFLAGSDKFHGDTSDPLVLDLDGDGLELTSLSQGSGSFDSNHDLYVERTAFAMPDDGVLAPDINGNGEIDQLRQQLAQHHNQTDGIEALKRSKQSQIGFLHEELVGIRTLKEMGLASNSV